MIESFLIKGFQKHETFALKLDPKVTVLAGASGSGKSSAYRSVRWLALNDPSGDEFVRLGCESAKVKLKVDGKVVKRVKGKGRNGYAIDGKDFAAFGTGVPDEIARHLNLTDLNFAGQLDPPFWMASGAGEVSRELNEIVRLDLIDKTMSNLASMARRNKAEGEVCQARLETSRTAVAALAWVDGVNAQLTDLEGLDAEIRALEGEIAEIRGLLAEIDRLEAVVGVGIPDLVGLGALAGEVEDLNNSILSIRAALAEVERLEEAVDASQARLGAAEGDLADLAEAGCPICGKPF